MIPKGFLFSTAEAAIKYSHRKDLALIYSDKEANIAGVFTTNSVRAAPVRLDMKRIRSGKGQAIIINSGNANACTGRQGIRDATDTAELVAHALRIKPSLVYVCSTGIIGVPMPMERVTQKISHLANNLGRSDIRDVARAIMTTDTFPKIATKKVRIHERNGIIAGICKGAGMIWPSMATMLCFLMTDIAVEQKTLEKTLVDAVKKSFNRISVDGDRSTNDTVLIMANGALGNPLLTEKSEQYNVFKTSLHEVALNLSKLIVKDGEGSTKYVEIEVKNARSELEAEKAAFSVANSNLVKTAIYGNDPNWGRIMAALGYSGVKIREDKIDIYFGKIQIVNKGTGTENDKKAAEILKGKKLRITINLNLGKSSATILTCDLTEEYIRENKKYRT
jgi:glutamate N-acetyltransferase/amino-acid N-acetyltransferase